MRFWRKWLLGISAFLLAAGLLLWFLPARWLMPWITPQLRGLQLQQVQGSLWDGSASQVVGADGCSIGRLQWQVSRRALLGQLRLRLNFEGPRVTFSGTMQRLPSHQIEWNAVTARIDLAVLGRASMPKLGQPRGELQLTVAHVLLQAGWPLQLQADAQWQHAAMSTQGGEVGLGELQLQAQAQGGVIQAHLRDDGHGPLAASGTLQLSPLGWRLDATLRSRQGDPALRRWLATLAPPAADGSVHIQRSGGLASNLSPPSPH